MRIKLQDIKILRERKAVMVLQAVFAYIGTCGIGYTCSLAAGSLFSNGIASVLVFAALWFVYGATVKNIAGLEKPKAKRRRILCGSLSAWIFSAFYIAGWQLRMQGMLDSGFLGKGRLLFHAVLLAFALFPVFNVLFWAAERVAGKAPAAPVKVWKSKSLFLIVWALIFLAWIPVFLAYYPAVMADDFHRQSQEAMRGFIWFNDYQPLAHTWLIWVALRIGEALGSYQTGMACFSIFQMLVLSASCAYACVMIYRLAHRKWAVAVMALLYGFLPNYSVHAVSTTKDVMFTALFQVFLCLFLERTFFCRGKRQNLADALWVAEGIVMMLFRNNALYAVAVFSVFFFFLAGRKQHVRALVLSLLLVVGGKGALEGMHLVLGTEGRGSKMEMFSVPLQQFARVGSRQGDALDEETRNLLTIYVPEEFWTDYNPPLADTVKIPVGTYVFEGTWRNHYGDLFLAWARIGLKYPNEYIDAFLILTSGYWFWDDVSWAEVYGTGTEGRMGAISTYMSSTSEVLPNGIPHESKWPAMERLMEEIVSANRFYDWPVLSNLFKPAFWCWGLVFAVTVSLYTRKRKTFMISLLPLVYFGTMLLGPVVRVRYVLPVMVAVPLLFAAWVHECRETSAAAEEKPAAAAEGRNL